MYKSFLLTVNSITNIIIIDSKTHEVERVELTNYKFAEILIYCVVNRHMYVLELLQIHGHDIHTKNQYGLRLSAYLGYLDMVKFFIYKGANVKNSIKYCTTTKSKKFLKVYVHTYKGEINEQTETDCGFCLTKMCSKKQKIIQCDTCNKCVHDNCDSKWIGNCIYCRN